MKINRRDLLKFFLFFNLPFLNKEINSKEKERVVLIRDKNLFNKKNRIEIDVLKDMIISGFSMLDGEKEVDKALSKNFKKDEVVGIKTNEWEPLKTPLEVEEFLKELLIKFGIKDENILIADRSFLKMKILEKCTSLINIRPMRTHHWAGVGSLIKNYIMFVKKPSDYHYNFCSNLGSIWHKPNVKDKTRINILILFTPLFYGVGAHHFNKRFTWNYCGILFGKKPAPVDAVGLKILKEKRKEYFGKEIPFQPPPIHIQIADKIYNLGTTNLNEIEIIKSNPMSDDLI